MSEKKCSSFNLPAASNMDIELLDKKDVSKVFAYLRNKLNGKEKELLELQRAESSLLAPDVKQIEGLIDAISSLHLSTQDGSFVFASTLNSNETPVNSTVVCSTDVDSIKTLPSTSWLSKKTSVKQENEEQSQYRLPMVTQLFSLPITAYVRSSSSSTLTPTTTNDQPSNRLPMVSQLLSMPISAFKSSSTSTNESTLAPVTKNGQPSNRLPMVSQLLSMPISAFKSSSSSSTLTSENKSPPVQIEEKKETVNKEEPKSILISESTYSKEHWLKKSSSSESDFVHLDLDDYIAQSTEKMRRLHTEYLQAIEKLNVPTSPIDSPQMLKTMYPQMFDRINEDITPKPRPPSLPAKK